MSPKRFTGRAAADGERRRAETAVSVAVKDHSMKKKKKRKERRKEKTVLFTGFTGTARDEETLGEGSIAAPGRDNLMAV